MKEYLFWYPCVGAIFWLINWIMARLGLVDTLIPLRLWILGGFTIAWIPYTQRLYGYWFINLAFMLGVPFALYYFLYMIIPAMADYDVPDDDNEMDAEIDNKEIVPNEIELGKSTEPYKYARQKQIQVEQEDKEAERIDRDRYDRAINIIFMLSILFAVILVFVMILILI